MIKRTRRRTVRRSPRSDSGMVTISKFSRSLLDTSRPRLSPRVRRSIRLVAGAVIAYLFIAGNMGAWRLVSLLRAEAEMKEQEAGLYAEIFALDTRQRFLTSDTTYIERIARTEYNLSRPDERIYILDEPLQ